MGAMVCDAVAADPALALVAAVDPKTVGQEIHGVEVGAELRALADAGCDVVVDFTVAGAATISAVMDQGVRISLPAGARDVLIGNPAIADINVIDSRPAMRG